MCYLVAKDRNAQWLFCSKNDAWKASGGIEKRIE